MINISYNMLDILQGKKSLVMGHGNPHSTPTFYSILSFSLLPLHALLLSYSSNFHLPTDFFLLNLQTTHLLKESVSTGPFETSSVVRLVCVRMSSFSFFFFFFCFSFDFFFFWEEKFLLSFCYVVVYLHLWLGHLLIWGDPFVFLGDRCRISTGSSRYFCKPVYIFSDQAYFLTFYLSFCFTRSLCRGGHALQLSFWVTQQLFVNAKIKLPDYFVKILIRFWCRGSLTWYCS